MLLFQHPAKTDCFCWILQPFWRIDFLCHFFSPRFHGFKCNPGFRFFMFLLARQNLGADNWENLQFVFEFSWRGFSGIQARKYLYILLYLLAQKVTDREIHDYACNVHVSSPEVFWSIFLCIWDGGHWCTSGSDTTKTDGQKDREPFAPQKLLCCISLSLQFQGHIWVFFIAQTHCWVRLRMWLGESKTCWFTHTTTGKTRVGMNHNARTMYPHVVCAA